MPPHFRHLDAGADRRRDLLRIGDEIVRHLLLRHEGIGIAGKRHVGKPVVPGRPVGDQRVPAVRAPAFGDPVALEHDMRDARPAQMLAHGDAGLAGPHDDDLGLLDRHVPTPPRRFPTIGQIRAQPKGGAGLGKILSF